MFRRLLTTLFLPLAVLIVALLLSSQWIVEQAILTNLRAQGYQASLESVRLSAGQLTLRNLRVSRDGEPVTRIQNLVLRHQLGDLWRGRVAVRELLIDGALLTLREDNEGHWQLIGLPSLAEKDIDNDGSGEASLAFGIQRIDLRDSRIRLIRPFGERIANLDVVYIGPLATWTPDTETPFQLSVHGTFGQVDVNGAMSPFAAPAQLHGKLAWQQAALAQIADFALAGLPTPLTSLRGQLASQVEFTASGDAQSWDASGHARIRAGDVDIASTDEQHLNAAEFLLDVNFSATPARQSIDGDMSARDLNAAQPQGVIQISEYRWQGTAGIRMDDAGSHPFADAKVDVDGISLESGPDMHAQLDHAGWQGQVERHPAGRLDVKGELRASGANFDLAGINGKLAKGSWTGGLSGNPEKTLSLDGAMALDTLSAQQGEREIKARQLRWSGEAELAVSSGQTRLKGDASLANAAFEDNGINATLAALHARALELLSDTDGLKSVRTDLRVGGLQATQAPQSLQIAELDAPSLAFKPPATLHAGVISVAGMQADVVRQATESETVAKAEAPPAANDAMEAKTDITIAGVTLKDSQVNFSDETLSPAFTAPIRGIDLQLGGFSSAHPDTPSTLELTAILGEIGQLEVNGKLRPLQPTAFAELSGSLLGFDMPELNPYLRAELGDEVESGQLDVNADIRIERNQLDVLNQIEVRKLVLRKAAGTSHRNEQSANGNLMDGASADNGGGGSLLNSAVSLLSDSNDTIKLKLPITGAVDDPRFDLSDAINTALSKSIATGVLLYFQPLGALVAVGKLASSQFSVLEFNPVRFQPGDADLDPAATIYLADLAKRLADRPKINIKVCARATESDRRAMQAKAASPKHESAKQNSSKQGSPEQDKPSAAPTVDNVALLKLAKQRANTVKHQLSDALGIDAKRLIGCAAGIAKQADAKPEVRLGQ